MWTRAELKDRAKFAFKRNYWRSVLISLLLALLIGGGSGAGSAGSAMSSALGSDGSDITSDSYDDFYDDADDIWYGMNDVYDNTDHTALLFAGVIFVVIFMIVFVIIMTVTILLDAFIFNPLEVGCKRFYLRNLNEAALVGNAGYAFDNNYKNIAKTMFFRDLYTVLWSMLFIIPGIVKSYEYQMIPYLLADNPQMTKEEAFAESKRMMQGQKWNAFVLDLSFIGWDILSGMTMGIYIFSWKVLKEALTAMKDQSNCDFGKHIIPYCHEKKQRLFAYEYNGYWKDVGTLGSYWEANMELIDLIPEFNLYEEYWKIYTKSDIIQPQYLSADSIVEKSIIGEGSEIYGEVHSSVIGAGVTIGKGSVVRDSIIMKGTQIGENVVIDKAIIAENCSIGDNVTLGVGEEKPNKFNEKIYSFGLVTIGEDSEVPSNVSVGKNTAISGKTTKEDYPEGILDSGEVIIKAGDSE